MWYSFWNTKMNKIVDKCDSNHAGMLKAETEINGVKF